MTALDPEDQIAGDHLTDMSTSMLTRALQLVRRSRERREVSSRIPWDRRRRDTMVMK